MQRMRLVSLPLFLVEALKLYIYIRMLSSFISVLKKQGVALINHALAPDRGVLGPLQGPGT